MNNEHIDFTIIDDNTLLDIYRSKQDWTILLKDNSIIKTNNYEFAISFKDDCIYLFDNSDFDAVFSMQEELQERGLIK